MAQGIIDDTHVLYNSFANRQNVQRNQISSPPESEFEFGSEMSYNSQVPSRNGGSKFDSLKRYASRSSLMSTMDRVKGGFTVSSLFFHS